MIDVHKLFGLLGFELWQTGGGCTAFGLNLGDPRSDPECAHILVTESDDGIAPDDSTEKFTVGFFDDDHDGGTPGEDIWLDLDLRAALYQIAQLSESPDLMDRIDGLIAECQKQEEIEK